MKVKSVRSWYVRWVTAPTRPANLESLAEAYRLAAYFVDLEGDAIEIAVGHRANRLEAHLPGPATFAYISACNPGSELRPEAENRRADGELRAEIERQGLLRWPMHSSSPDGEWWEAGWLVGDAPATLLDGWARRFRQSGILLWRRGEAVRLRMYGRAGSPHSQIDWIE